MKRLAARLPIALTTFLLSLLVTVALTKVPAIRDVPLQNCDKLPTTNATPAATPNSLHSEPARAAAKTPRISQQEIITFPGIGRVRVTANEACYECPNVEFRDATSNKYLISENFSDGDDAIIRFKVMHVKGLPDPLIVGISVSPGGSDAGWESVAVGAVDGKLKDLTHEPLETANQGGFFYGDLGGGRGFGAISWCFVWDDGNGHYAAHSYELKVYKWSQESKRFEWQQVLRTHSQFDDGVRAVRSLGFTVRDVRKTFPDFKDFFE
jgi:hypothetical protein